MKTMASIAVIGDKEFVLGFKLAGIRATYIDEKIEERLNTLLHEKKMSIIILHDTDYNNLSAALKKKANESIEPVVISVGKLHEENIREKIKRAIGIDVYKTQK